MKHHPSDNSSRTNFISGFKTQCATQRLGSSDDVYLAISDSWFTKRKHEVVEIRSDAIPGAGDVWHNLRSLRTSRRDFTDKEELPIMAAVRNDTTFVFWMSGNDMNLIELGKSKMPHLEVINKRFGKLFNQG